MLRRLPVHLQFIAGTAIGVCGWLGPAEGQDGRVPRPDPTQQQVAPRQQAQPQVARELIPILQAWEQRSAAIDRVHAELKRFDYDHVFKIEKRAVGEYWFEAPDKGRFDIRPDGQIPNPPRNDFTRDGVTHTYSVQADSHQVWICTGKEILDIDVPNKSYNRVQIPPQYQGERITDGPLPFLFGMKAAKVMDRYVLSVGSMHDPEGKRSVPDGAPAPEPIIHIVAFPLDPRLQQEFRKAEILLNPKTFTPHAVKLFDPTGNRETVYVFGAHKKPNWFEGKPWNVNLKAYTLMIDQQAPPEESVPNGAPNPNEGPLQRDVRQPGILIK